MILAPASQSAHDSLTALTQASAPTRDMVALVNGFRGTDLPRVAQDTASEYAVGDTAVFWVGNHDDESNRQAEAVLVYRSEALNMWLEAGEDVDIDDMRQAAQDIEQHILPTNRAFFGDEWRPGVDGDNRIHILHTRDLGRGVAAYYSSADEYIMAVNPLSNEREMIYVNLDVLPINSELYLEVIAHEIQHLIHWYIDQNEDGWLNEGLSELAALINGYEPDRLPDYAGQTDIQLNTLSQEPDVVAAHYASAYLFSVYFYDRFGEEATQALVRHSENGLAGVEATLSALGQDLTAEDLFADWLVTNYLAGVNRGQAEHQYQSIQGPLIKPRKIDHLPASAATTVQQFGADYYQIESDSAFTLIFTGTQQTALVTAQPRSGDFFWITLPGDDSDMRLTRPFDLAELNTATLTFWTWYDIEAGWDYGYVSVSTDDGRTWDLLTTESTTFDNPQGNSYGPGYTGLSGSSTQAEWVQETADLTPYTGQEILLRFQYITDDAIHEQGFAIDDIAIPELDYEDDAESHDRSWLEEGFVRTTQFLPQQFIVQRILLGDTAVRVERLQLDESQQGQWYFPMDRGLDTAILIISGSTPVTQQSAAYAYALLPAKP